MQSILFLSGRPAVAEALSGKRESHVAHFIRSLKPLGFNISGTGNYKFPDPFRFESRDPNKTLCTMQSVLFLSGRRDSNPESHAAEARMLAVTLRPENTRVFLNNNTAQNDINQCAW